MIEKHNNNDLSSTLFIPLWARVKDHEMNISNANDKYASIVLGKLNYNTTNLENLNSVFKQLTINDLSIRSGIIDNQLINISKNDDKLIVYNIGCGLDSRFLRIGNTAKIWYDIDLPEVVKTKSKLFGEKDNYKLIESDFFELSNYPLHENATSVFILEGVLMYYDESDVREYLSALSDRFPDSYIILEVIGKLAQNTIHPAIKALGLKNKYKWGISNYNSIKNWNKRLKIIDINHVLEPVYPNWRSFKYIFKLLPFIKKLAGSTILTLKT